MDLFAYIILVTVLGFIRVRTTKDISDDVGLVTVGTVAVADDIPVGNNLYNQKEQGAYTFILYELGLLKW